MPMNEAEPVDPARAGRQMREEHGWAKAQLLLLYAVLESFWRADSWSKRGKMALWFTVYGVLALLAVGYWLIAWPLGKLWSGLKWAGRLTQMGFEKLLREPGYLKTSAVRDIPKLPRVAYYVLKNAAGRVRGWGSWLWTQLTGLWASTVEYFTGLGINETLPPSIRDNLSWIFGLLPRAAGVRDTSRREQINANVVILVVMALSSLFPLTTWTVAFAFIPAGLLLFAFFFRGTPAGESYWRQFRARLPIKDNYDIPLWRGE
jgi:hypothetical protein